MEVKKPSIPTFDAPVVDRDGEREGVGWEHYCTKCGYIFGWNHTEGAADHTRKRLSKMECPECGEIAWESRQTFD